MSRSVRIRARNDASRCWRQAVSTTSVLLWMTAVPSVLAFLQSANLRCVVPKVMTERGHWQHKQPLWMSSSFPGGGDEDQAMEAIQSLADFHQGEWKGTARSFSVTPDVAAGIVQRKTIEDYNIAVKLAMTQNQQFVLSETISWDDNNQMAFRSLPLQETDFDIDAVDASYSLDTATTTQSDFPSSISGTKKPCSFLIEHCIATGEDRRARCFGLYGEDESLIRIVISNEERISNDKSGSTNGAREDAGVFTAKDLLEMQNDVDRLVDKIVSKMPKGAETTSSSETTPPVEKERETDNINGKGDEDFMSRLGRVGESVASTEGAQSLKLHDMSLLELSSGVWLGDAIIRDSPGIAGSPTERGGRGFGSKSGGAEDDKDSWKSKTTRALGDWSVGVQKIAWRWMWNFGEEIRQVVDVGKALGSSLEAPIIESVAGNVCVDESLSRRIPKQERMVYVDWPQNDSVSFLAGPFLVQFPRYINFDPSAASASRTLNKPFMTEFGVFQRAQGNDESGGDASSPENGAADLPELVCSKSNRLYNFEGRLKQGFSSFYTLERFGNEEGEED